jgi:zinc D-Ala-D-Ala carboxypeptidase
MGESLKKVKFKNGAKLNIGDALKWMQSRPQLRQQLGLGLGHSGKNLRARAATWLDAGSKLEVRPLGARIQLKIGRIEEPARLRYALRDAKVKAILQRRWNNATESVAQRNARIGIAPDYATQRRLQPIADAKLVIEVDRDRFGRALWLAPRAANQYRRLLASAHRDGIALDVVSAFRSMAYQHALVMRKRGRGIDWNQILQVSTAPGYSEHHSGNAIDFASGNDEILTDAFAETAAFAWLQTHAPARGFRMSFPRDNPHGVCYEPWHWYFQRKHRQRGPF